MHGSGGDLRGCTLLGRVACLWHRTQIVRLRSLLCCHGIPDQALFGLSHEPAGHGAEIVVPEMVPATASLGQCMAGTVPFADELGMDLPQCVSLAYV